MQKLILATRSSPLALWQANYVAQKLQVAGFQIEIKSIETIGDKKLDVTLSKIGDKGVFTQELDKMLLDGEAHIAVHSAKDVPSHLPEGLQIIAFTDRENPCDVIVSNTESFKLENRKMLIGTSSTRRVATLRRYFPAIETVAIRGNLQTRIRKMQDGHCDALMLAYAGVFRMGYTDLIQEELDIAVFTPAVGQGCLAIEASAELNDDVKIKINMVLNHFSTSISVEAERAFLKTMEGGCSVPVFCHASFNNSTVHILGGIISLDGLEEVRKMADVKIDQNDLDSVRKVGEDLAKSVLSSNGNSILEKIKQTLHP